MLVDVVRLRRAGMRLRPSELEPPVRGMLTVKMDDGRHSSFKRPVLEATLQAPRGVNGQMLDVLLPIFDVRIVAAGGGSMTLQGIELNAVPDDGTHRIYEHVQLWRCVPVLADSTAG